MKQTNEAASQKDETEVMKGIGQPMELSLWSRGKKER